MNDEKNTLKVNSNEQQMPVQLIFNMLCVFVSLSECLCVCVVYVCVCVCVFVCVCVLV